MKAVRVSGYLRDVTWKNKYLITGNTVKLYNAMVRLIMTYAVEPHANTNKITQRIRTTEMNTLVGKQR